MFGKVFRLTKLPCHDDVIFGAKKVIQLDRQKIRRLKFNRRFVRNRVSLIPASYSEVSTFKKI